MAVDPMAIAAPEAVRRTLCRRLSALRRRIRLALVVFLGARGLALLAAAGTVTILAHKLRGILYPSGYVWLTLLMAAALAVVAAMLWRLPDATVARAVDRRLGSRDRLATAIELLGAAERSGMDRAQIADAVGYVAAVRPARAFPVRLDRMAKVMLGCLAALLIVHFAPIPALLLGARERDDRVQLRHLARAMKPEVERLEREAEATDDPEAREAARRLRTLTRRMERGTIDRKQALVELAEAERDLEQLRQGIRPPSLRTAQAAAEEMGRQGREGLAAQARELAHRAGRKGDTQRKEQLEELGRQAESATSPEQVMQVAAELSEQAEALGMELPLTAAMSVLSQAVGAEDWAAAQSVLEALRDCLSDGDRPISPKEAMELAEAMEAMARQLDGTELQDLAECLRQAGQCLRQGDCKGAAACLGAGSGREGMSAVRLQEATRGAGKCAGKCAGALRGAGNGQSGVGVGPDDGSRQGIPPGTPGASLYAPRETPVDPDAERVPVPVRPGGDMAATTTRGAPGSASESRVPYYQVMEDYSRAAEDALSREEVPPAYRQTVREYFDSLQTRSASGESSAGEEATP